MSCTTKTHGVAVRELYPDADALEINTDGATVIAERHDDGEVRLRVTRQGMLDYTVVLGKEPGTYCNACLADHDQDDVDGGRCLKCGAMLCGITEEE